MFVQNGTTWTQQATLTDATPSNRFGYSVALRGNFALVGEPFKTVGGNALQGAAYVFVRNGTTWTQQAELTAGDGAGSDQFGWSVALNGSIALVGAFSKFPAGAAYVFVRSGATWIQLAKLTASDGAQGDAFGYSVALSGTTVLIGADGKNNDTGAAYVFVRSGAAWTQQAELIAGDGAQGDFLGSAVALSGNTTLVGAYGSNSLAGAAYAFVGH
jgi:hypothetical protein